MVNPRQKGIRGEQQVIAILDRVTNEKWEQTPGSGSGKIKGDLRVHGKHNIFCVEVKFYKHVGFDSKIYTQKSNNLFKWWSKICKQAQQMKQEPLLIFRENHGKFFEDLLDKEEIKFPNGNFVLKPWEPSSDWELADS